MRQAFLSWAGAIALAIAVPCQCVAAQGHNKAPPPAAQPPSFTLDIAAAGSREVTLTVQPPATIPLKIIRSGGPVAGKVTLDATGFSNEQGTSAPATLTVEGVAGPGKNHVDEISFAGSALGVDLHVPELPRGGKSKGHLTLTVPGLTEPVTWNFNLTSAGESRTATLVLDQNAVTVAITRPWCIWRWCPLAGDSPVVTVHVRDKSGNSPLSGVMARLEPAAKGASPGIDLKKHLTVQFDGNNVPDVFSMPGGVERNVEARGQATITLAFNEFDAGEYTLPLRFTAKNSLDDDLQRLTVTLQVRDHLLSAALVLLLAAFVSYLATRVVTTLRERGRLLARIHALRPAWLASEPTIAPVIWLRAILRQAEALSRPRFWFLAGQNEIDDRLNAAERMLGVLTLVRQMRNRIDSIPNAKLKLRASWNFDDIVARLPAAPLSEQECVRFKADLEKLEEWCDPATQHKVFWAHLLPAIRARHADVQRFSFNVPAANELAALLRENLARVIDHEPTELDEMIAAQENYERLSILWEARNHDRWVQQLVELHPLAVSLATPAPWKPVEKVYEVVDEGWWRLLNDMPSQNRKIDAPTSTLDPPEAYESVLFRLCAADPNLQHSYLMQKKLTYRWIIEVLPRRRRWFRRKKASVSKLEAVSTQPQVTQYSPKAGRMNAKVRIEYQGREGPTVELSAPVRIRRSTDFGVLGVFELADVIAFGVALVTSIVSGIVTYALVPTFGSLKEYIALFTWGASLDQGKNLLQSLAVYSKSPAATQAPVAQPAPATTRPTAQPAPAAPPAPHARGA